MTPRLRLLVAALALAAGVASRAAADRIELNNGRVIEADRAWFEGNEVRYEKDGGTFGLPRSLVKSLEQRSPLQPTRDADILRARDLLSAGRAAEAVRSLKPALNRDPNSLAALHVLVEAHLRLGETRQARDVALKAVRLDERNPRSHALLGDALATLGDHAGAEAEYRRSLLLRPDAEVERRLSGVAPPAATATPASAAAPATPSGAQFRIRYDGGINEPLGDAVLSALNAAQMEYAKRLGFSPGSPVTVVLQTSAEFQADGRAPEWASGVNDGTIRVPVGGLDGTTPQLVQVLRHELAHSFLTDRTGGNCPTWLQEGVAQWLEGGDPAREDARVAAAAQSRTLHALLTLEAPFRNLSQTEATLAYAESLSAVAHILRKRGEAGLVRLIAALGDGLPSEEALPVSLGLSYPEFQKSWEDYLGGLR